MCKIIKFKNWILRPTFKVSRLENENTFQVKLYVTCARPSNSRTEYRDQLSRYLDLGIKINLKLNYMSLVQNYQIQELNTEKVSRAPCVFEIQDV